MESRKISPKQQEQMKNWIRQFPREKLQSAIVTYEKLVLQHPKKNRVEEEEG